MPIEDNDHHDSTTDSRRRFLQRSALAGSALALGVPGTTAAQETTESETTTSGGGAATGGGKAQMFNDEFRPGAQFRVKSPVIEQHPQIDGVSEGNFWSEYNTRIIEYLNTNEEVYFFPAEAAEIQQGSVYELQTNFTLFADDVADEGVITVSFDEVGDDDVLVDTDDNQLVPDDDFDVIEGGGKALVRGKNFFPGALLELTSGVVDWTPREEVQESDIFSEYNTRHAEYLNTNDEFTIYPAEAADVTEGGIYVVREEFDVTDPAGLLVTADLDRVNEDDLEDGWL
ncbi:twin-arginine translocation signal domain-containing protein [Haloarculaceae archaeon H-GB2-1]|nr:twin-arginine translocation signal domain-containing protein [Haloarculaceae archaeon H-GB1-1]MEA5389604.1 twin-arginine translocation signal domain-containing protein [Haloarculaceae archaeon H-GB11]MEA5410131.1 twin-arginine translocation signal domain-containing protein [Haloarculaceae archaeon H-GB2-1]